MFPMHPFAAFVLFTSCMYYLFTKRTFQVWGTYKKTNCMATQQEAIPKENFKNKSLKLLGNIMAWASLLRIHREY